MAILITKYKTGVDFPPLRTGLTHEVGENTLTFPYKAGDEQGNFSSSTGVHLLLINGGALTLTDDTDTFSVAFGSSDITITWHSQRNSLRDIDDVVFVFNAFSKPTEGITRLRYTATSGQTAFSGNDVDGTPLAFQNGAVMVFQNDNYLETTDYNTNTANTVTLNTGATAGDKISIIAFDSVTDQTDLNNALVSTAASESAAAASATDAAQHKTTASRWAKEADTTSVVDADTGVDSNEFSAKAYAQGTGTTGGSSKEWASKTGSAVAGGEYSAKHQANTATTKASEAADSAADAQKLAINAEDTNFVLSDGATGGFSALHYNAKASAQATIATTKASEASDDAADAQKLANNPEDSQFTLSDGSTQGFSALHYNEKALDSKNAASGSATTASNKASDAEKLAINAEDSQFTLSTGTTGFSALHYNAKAQAAKTAMDTTFDNFDDRFLGTKTSDPSTDNDGNALSVGAVYYNSTASEVRFYNGSSWDAPAASAATSATTATTKASEASNSASAASTSATAAASSASSAATSATSAANNLSSFQALYSSGATDPTTNLDAGDLFFNTTINRFKVYNGSAWDIGVSSSAADLLTSIKTVDGTGSGLDADTVDGIEGANFVRSDINDTVAGVLTLSNYLNRTTSAGNSAWLQQDGTGRVHWYWNTIGGSSPTYNSASEEAASITLNGFINTGGEIKFRVTAANANTGGAGSAITWLTVADFRHNQLNLRKNTSVTGNITVSGTVDGRDVAADGTKLDTIETNADVTANAGAAMLTGAAFTGDVTFTGDSNNIVFDKSDNALEFADNAKATFGADADLAIYHDTNNSIIEDTGTGDLHLKGGNDVKIYEGTDTLPRIELTGTGINLSSDDSIAALNFYGRRNTGIAGYGAPMGQLSFYGPNASSVGPSNQEFARIEGLSDYAGSGANQDWRGRIDFEVQNNAGSFDRTFAVTYNGCQVDGALDLNGSVFEQVFNLGTNATVNLDPDNGTIQYKECTANTTITESFSPGQSMTLMLSTSGTNSYTVTWPTITWASGQAPTIPTSGYVTVVLWDMGTFGSAGLRGAEVG